MRQLEAMRATIILARERHYDPRNSLPGTSDMQQREALSLEHFEDMFRRAASEDQAGASPWLHPGCARGGRGDDAPRGHGAEQVL